MEGLPPNAETVLPTATPAANPESAAPSAGENVSSGLPAPKAEILSASGAQPTTSSEIVVPQAAEKINKLTMQNAHQQVYAWGGAIDPKASVEDVLKNINDERAKSGRDPILLTDENRSLIQIAQLQEKINGELKANKIAFEKESLAISKNAADVLCRKIVGLTIEQLSDPEFAKKIIGDPTLSYMVLIRYRLQLALDEASKQAEGQRNTEAISMLTAELTEAATDCFIAHDKLKSTENYTPELKDAINPLIRLAEYNSNNPVREHLNSRFNSRRYPLEFTKTIRPGRILWTTSLMSQAIEKDLQDIAGGHYDPSASRGTKLINRLAEQGEINAEEESWLHFLANNSRPDNNLFTQEATQFASAMGFKLSEFRDIFSVDRKGNFGLSRYLIDNLDPICGMIYGVDIPPHAQEAMKLLFTITPNQQGLNIKEGFMSITKGVMILLLLQNLLAVMEETGDEQQRQDAQMSH
ncbi:hypothetical protein HY029_05770 [Candidatus Gottesmanbacteria bacterium]|nr:hypothetical protein [Candidatus Gottesmanbacteria bacterium]